MSIFKQTLAAAAACMAVMCAAGPAASGEAEIVALCSGSGSAGPEAIAAFVNEQRQGGQSPEQIDKALINVTVALGESVLETGCSVRKRPVSACVWAVTSSLADPARRAAVAQIADKIENGACDERVAASSN